MDGSFTGKTLQVGAANKTEQTIKISIKAMNATGLGISKLKDPSLDKTSTDTLATQAGAKAAISLITKAIAQVSSQRSSLGAIQNRLEHTIKNLDNIVENTTAAESAIRDTDMASAMVKYSTQNILAQAGQSMLAQANQATQGVMNLLQ